MTRRLRHRTGAPMSEEARLREHICRCGASLFARGLTFGSTGNISASLPGGAG